MVRVHEVGGSNPLAPTKNRDQLKKNMGREPKIMREISGSLFTLGVKITILTKLKSEVIMTLSSSRLIFLPLLSVL